MDACITVGYMYVCQLIRGKREAEQQIALKRNELQDKTQEAADLKASAEDLTQGECIVFHAKVRPTYLFTLSLPYVSTCSLSLSWSLSLSIYIYIYI